MPDLKVLALPVFAVLILIEAVLSALRQQQAYELKDFGASMSQLAMNILAKLGVDVVIIGFHFYLYQYRLVDWAGNTHCAAESELRETPPTEPFLRRTWSPVLEKHFES